MKVVFKLLMKVYVMMGIGIRKMVVMWCMLVSVLMVVELFMMSIRLIMVLVMRLKIMNV